MRTVEDVEESQEVAVRFPTWIRPGFDGLVIKCEEEKVEDAVDW